MGKQNLLHQTIGFNVFLNLAYCAVLHVGQLPTKVDVNCGIGNVSPEVVTFDIMKGQPKEMSAFEVIRAK